MATIAIPEPLDRWRLNDVDLHTLAWQVEGRSGQMVAPVLLADDLQVAGWHGELDPHAELGQQRRPFGRGRWRLTAWVLGVDPVTGAVLPQAGSLASVQARGEEILRLLYARSVRIGHIRTDGTTRQATGHLDGNAVEVELNPNSPWFGRIRADLVLPDPFWYDTGAPVTASASLTTGGTLNLTAFAEASAPMRNTVVEFGVGNNPSLAHAGGFVAWDGLITSGRALGVATNPRDPSLYAAAGSWTPAYTGLRYSPGPSWFELDPAVPTATLSHTGGGLMTVSVTAQLAHLTA
jgi:hypothetical protein